jgi:hypothetical protein
MAKRRPATVVHHPATLYVTGSGKDAWRKLYRGEQTFPNAGIVHEEWIYLGFLMSRGSIEADSVREKYGTEGAKICQKLLELEYIARREAYET